MSGAFVVDSSRSPHARLRPVSVADVSLEGGLWGERLHTLAAVGLPGQRRRLEEAGVLDNFRRAAGTSAGPHRGLEFADTDLYKWLEAACWCLAGGAAPPGLRREVEEAIALVGRAQEPDGYLDTLHAGEPEARWTNLRAHHELYCVGHLVQAAIADHRVNGSERLLDVARRAADLACATFGPGGPLAGRIDGHPGVEMALVELHRETGEQRYLATARQLVEARGHGTLAGGRLGAEYYLDHAPLRALERLGGHVVRALYHASGATDLCLETGDGSLQEALTRLWTHLVQRQVYVSGGLGSRPEVESFGGDLELPNARACCETCGGVASVMWSQRMLALTGEARYADLVEWTLLNAVLPGWSQDGTAYFYENPLQDDGGRRRQPWYECACCPPNLARLLAALPGLLYGTCGDALFVHHYAASRARLEVGGRAVVVTQRTRYPWDGLVELELDGEGELALHLRVPGWCRGRAALEVNGVPAGACFTPGSHAELRRRWTRGDRVTLRLPMPVQALQAHPAVLEDAGRVALTRGPVLYCLEGTDHPGVDLRRLSLDPRQAFRTEWRGDLLGGVVVVRGAGSEQAIHPAWDERLYARAGELPAGSPRPVELLAVPYHTWANRSAGPMQIWLAGARPAPPPAS